MEGSLESSINLFAESDQRKNLNQRVKESINIIKRILEYDQVNKEFKVFDRQVVATHIIYFIDSLKTTSSIVTMPKETLMKQMNLLKELIL